MTLIQQRKNGDCGVACLAMLFEIPYEEALSFFPNNDFDNDGLSISEMAKFFDHMDSVAYESHYFDLKTKSILFVPSLNNKGGGHFVYWGGPGKLFDPSTKEVYTTTNFPIVISQIIQLEEIRVNELIEKYKNSIEEIKKKHTYYYRFDRSGLPSSTSSF